jgi:hypothetical protein
MTESEQVFLLMPHLTLNGSLCDLSSLFQKTRLAHCGRGARLFPTD